MIKLKSQDPKELYQIALQGVASQGGPSVNRTESISRCSYHNNGRKCGVGHILDATPEQLEVLDKVEDNAISGLIENGLVDVGDVDSLLLEEFQTVHDLFEGKNLTESQFKTAFTDKREQLKTVYDELV